MRDPQTGQTARDRAAGKDRVCSAVLKAFINGTGKSVNLEFTNTDPTWTMRRDDCTAALFTVARRVTEAAYPHLAPPTIK